jgi:hypothetical protein
MINSDLIIRKHPIFLICSLSDILKKNSSLKIYFKEYIDCFFLIYNNDYSIENIVSVDIATASLLYSISKKPMTISSIQKKLNKQIDITILSLLFNNIIQVRNDKKEYESGPTCSIIVNALNIYSIEKANHDIQKLSNMAIQYGWYFRYLRIEEIVGKLYTYGTMPQDYSLHSHLNNPLSILNWLNASKMDKTWRNYIQTPLNEDHKHWIYWQRKSVSKSENLNYKIYISPIPMETPCVFCEVINTCHQLLVPAFKIGATSKGIHRPDKFVLYFNNIESIQTFTSATSNYLKSFQSQGVPFTSPLFEKGIMSFAQEPSESKNMSWRIFISGIIARTLKLYSFHHKELEIEHILLKLNLLGIQTNFWNKANLSLK